MITTMKQPKTLRGVKPYKFKSKEDFDKFLSAKNGYMNKQIADMITENGKHNWDVVFNLKRFRSGIAQIFIQNVLTQHIFTEWTMQFLEPVGHETENLVHPNNKIYTYSFCLESEYTKDELQALIEKLKSITKNMKG